VRTVAALLGLLALATAAQEAPAATAALDVAYTDCGGMICVTATLADQHQHLLLFDTGNVSSWLTVDAARAVGATLAEVQADGKTLPGVFRAGEQRATVGGLPFEARFLAFDAANSGALPPGVDGALAYPVFKDRVVQVDFARRRFRILSDHTRTAAGSGTLQLVTFGEHGPPIVVGSGFALAGRPFRAQIDTCFTGTLVVYDAARAALGVDRLPGSGAVRAFPYTDGGVNMAPHRGGPVTLAAAVLMAQPATLYVPAPGDNEVHQPDGLFEATVGTALFAHQVLTLDFHAMSFSVSRG
jgi:hypothetical protein